MRIIFYVLTIAFLFSTTAFADSGTGHNSQHTAGLESADHTISAQINGLVCDFCARALEKVFAKREEVSGINVNLDNKIVTIGLKKGTDIDNATITKLITDAGYNVIKIDR